MVNKTRLEIKIMAENLKVGATFDGLTFEQLSAKMAEFKKLETLIKAAKKAGVIEKTKAAPVAKPAEIQLLIECFKPIVEGNIDIIAPIFIKGIEGQDSVSFAVSERYVVIIRDMEVTKAKAKARKDAEAELKTASAELEE
jgi:2-iminoacetate synthase ThiH